MAVYDGGNMDRMRMEAVRRSQEMHRRSNVNSDKEQIEKEYHEEKGGTGDLLSTLTASLAAKKGDSDFILIAAIMWLLYKEGADIKILLALAYIIL